MDLFGTLTCGVDEAGRGPWAGPVTAAAVILDPANPIEGLTDSKKLSEAKREALAPLIRERAMAWCVAHASVEEIDRLNIREATFLAMRRAVEGLQHAPDLALIDGNALPGGLACEARAIVKGDNLNVMSGGGSVRYCSIPGSSCSCLSARPFPCRCAASCAANLGSPYRLVLNGSSSR